MSDAELKLFKGSSLARALEKIKSNVSDEQGDLEDLNVLLETFIQVQVTSKELNSICLDLVQSRKTGNVKLDRHGLRLEISIPETAKILIPLNSAV